MRNKSYVDTKLDIAYVFDSKEYWSADVATRQRMYM